MAKIWIFGFSPGVCPTGLSNLVFSPECLVSNGRQALLGGIRLGGSAIFRHLNAITAKAKYPVPVIEELLDELTHASWFTCLDLTAGYHQIRL